MCPADGEKGGEIDFCLPAASVQTEGQLHCAEVSESNQRNNLEQT